MTNAHALRAIAEQLKQDEPFFAKHDINGLQAFVRDKGCCRYCGSNLFESYDLASAVDHLLPKSRYPHLRHEISNLVAACGECNSIKADWNPADGDVLDADHVKSLSDEDRDRLSKKAWTEIQKRKARAPDWRNMFQRARDQFRTAVSKYENE